MPEPGKDGQRFSPDQLKAVVKTVFDINSQKPIGASVLGLTVTEAGQLLREGEIGLAVSPDKDLLITKPPESKKPTGK